LRDFFSAGEVFIVKPTSAHLNKRLVLLIAVILLLGFLPPFTSAIAAPPPDDPEPGEIRLGAEDEGGQVELKEGQVLAVSLEGNPSTGYTWELEGAEGKVLRQKGEVEFEPESRLLGAPGKQILRFEALREGQTDLRLVYRRPWEKGVGPAKTFSLRVKGVGPFMRSKGPTPTPTAAPSPVTAEEGVLGLPASFNWCDVGGCTPVKSQGSCGSCWTFGTVGPLEANIKIHDGLEKDLAEQYLLSCNTEGWGCNGGWWAHDYHGGDTPEIPPGEPDSGTVYEAAFPYQANDPPDVPCNPPHTHNEKLISWHYVGNPSSVPSTTAIKQAIYDYGPVSAAVCVGSAFSGYGGGIFQTHECTSVNHAVVLVGWDDTLGIWHLRNSWGTGWGESGYMRIKYGTSSVGYAASYVVYGGSSSIRLMYNNYTIDDDTGGESDGDNDGIVDCGETIEMYVALHNQGSETATGVNATISTGDPYITFTHNISSSYPDIAGSGTFTNTDDFEFEVDPSTPHGHPIQFNLDITATNGGPWTDSFYVPVACGGKITNAYLPIIVKVGGSCKDTQVVGNGGFESGNMVWVQSSGPFFIIEQSYPYGGFWDAWFGGYDDADDRLYQTINIPPGVSYAQLVFYLHIETLDSLIDDYDYFHVELQNASGGTLESFLPADNTMSYPGWYVGTRNWSNFSPHAGQTRRLFFQGTTDFSFHTNFFLDGVTLWTYCSELLGEGGEDGWTWKKIDAPPGYTPGEIRAKGR
jgi:C1A family cysteine protease/predicted secreted protein